MYNTFTVFHRFTDLINNWFSVTLQEEENQLYVSFIGLQLTDNVVLVVVLKDLPINMGVTAVSNLDHLLYIWIIGVTLTVLNSFTLKAIINLSHVLIALICTTALKSTCTPLTSCQFLLFYMDMMDECFDHYGLLQVTVEVWAHTCTDNLWWHVTHNNNVD